MKNILKAVVAVLLFLSDAPAFANGEMGVERVTTVCIHASAGYKSWFRIHANNGRDCPNCLNTTSGKIRIQSAPNERGYLCGLSAQPINPRLVWVNSHPKTGAQFASREKFDGEVLYLDPHVLATFDCHTRESMAAIREYDEEYIRRHSHGHTDGHDRQSGDGHGSGHGCPR